MTARRGIQQAGLVALALAVAAGLGTPGPAGARALAATYYVSAAGDDANDGRSEETAWRSLARVSSAPLAPGDGVLFRGGETFVGTLSAASSGTAAAPIRFGSYGGPAARIVAPSGAVAIYLNSNHDLTFDGLDLSAPSSTCVLASASGAGAASIVLRGLHVHDCGGYGLNSDNSADVRISLSNSIVEDTEDTGVAFRGASVTISANTIRNTGLNVAGTIAIPLHGIYAKGPGPSILDNRITGFQTSGITIRSTGSFVAGNVITARGRGLRGISYYQESAIRGTTTIRGNVVSGVRVQGVAIDNGAQTGRFDGGATTASTSESFVVTGNVIAMGGDTRTFAVEGIRLLKVPSAIVTGNRVSGRFTYAYAAYAPLGIYRGQANAWRTDRFARAFLWNGAPLTFSEFMAASSGGADSIF